MVWRVSLCAQALVDIILLEGMKFIETIETDGSEISALTKGIKANRILNAKSCKVLWMVIPGVTSFL